MQQTANFAPGGATWRPWRNIRVIFDSGLFDPLFETWRHPQNLKYISYCTAVTGGSSHGHRCRPTENLVKSGHVVFEICERTDEHTDRGSDIQTRWSQYFADLPGASSKVHSSEYCLILPANLVLSRQNITCDWLSTLIPPILTLNFVLSLYSFTLF